MKEQDEWRTWSLKGLTVTQLRFDCQFHVHMWSLDRDLLVSFGAPFTLHTRAGDSRMFDPERVETLCPLLSLLRRPAAEFAASSGGRCRLRLEDGSELRGEPHDRYEAGLALGAVWQLIGNKNKNGGSSPAVSR